MDVKLPNGVVLTGVPEGTPKHQIAMKAIQNGLATNKDFGYDEVTDEDVGGTFLEGMGAGMVNVARRGTNLLLPDSLTPDWASDEAIAEQEELDKYLTFGHGGGGKLVGEMVATLPAGGMAGRGAAALSKASRLPKYLANTLNRGAGRAAVEGATVGAILADPDERVGGAAGGAIVGGVLGAAGTALGKALGKGQMTQITREAKELQKLTGTFIPLSQSAEQGLTRQVYNAFLANFPGLGGKLRGQYKHALDDLRRFIGENAHPPRAPVNIGADDSVGAMITKLDDYWKTAFDDLKPWPVRVFSDVAPTMPNSLGRQLKSYVEDGLVVIPKSGDKLTAGQIMGLKNTIGELIPGMGHAARNQAIKYQKSLDALLKRNFNPTGKSNSQGAIAYADYLEATKYYPVWTALRKAAMSVDDMVFKPSRVAKGAPPSGTPVAQQAGRLSKEALEDFPSRQGLFQTLAATGPVLSAGAGAAAGGASGAGIAILATYGIGRAMLSKGLQKYLSGQTRTQRLNKVLMKRYSEELRKLGLGARQVAVVLGANDAT